MNDGNTGYPWSTGDVLFAADLNSAIANATNIAKAAGGDIIIATDYRVVGDYRVLSGPISWSGNAVTVAGANFVYADIGKTLVMPFGGAVGIGPDAPAIVKITAVAGPTTCTVDTSAKWSFSGASTSVSMSAPSTTIINTVGSGGALVGDVLTVAGGTFSRPATFYTLQIVAKSAAATANGSGGPPLATVYLTGTTGHGRRAVWSGMTDATGALSGALTLVDGGCLYQNVNNAAAEPLVCAQNVLSLPATWSSGATTMTLQGVHASVTALLRSGYGISGPGIAVGTVIIPNGNPGDGTIQFTPAATAAGTNVTLRFTSNYNPSTFQATFAKNATTITVTSGSLPAWVRADPVNGMLISGVGLVGIADPTTRSSDTYITAIDGTRTVLTISQPTQLAATTPVTVTMNPVLTGVTASMSFVPAVLATKDWGVYSVAPSTPAAVTGGANTGATVTPAFSPLTVGFGTDNAVGLNNWAAAVRAATAAVGNDKSVALEALLPAGCYLSTQGVNFVGLQATGLHFRWHGTVIHSCAVGQRAVDMRNGRYFSADSITIEGDQYFPPQVGYIAGRTRTDLQADQLFIATLYVVGCFTLAGAAMLNTESSTIAHMRIRNYQCPSAPLSKTAPLFGLIVDGWNHWNIPCDYDINSPIQHDTLNSFNDLRIINGSVTMPGGGIPYSIGGCKGLRIVNGYAATFGPPAVLFFGEASLVNLQMHCEAKMDVLGPGRGIQDQLMLASIKNPILQFNGEFSEYGTDTRNATFAFDLESNWSDLVATSLQCNWAKLDVLGYTTRDCQVFDSFGAMSPTTYGGDLFLGASAYTAAAHLFNRPSHMYGRIFQGDSSHSLSGDNGLIINDTVVGRINVVSDADMRAGGRVYAATGFAIGTVGLPLLTLTTSDGSTITSNAPINLPSTPPPGDNDTSVATTAFVQNAVTTATTGGPFLPLTGGALTGTLALSGNATLPLQAVPFQQLNSVAAGFLPLTGGTVTGSVVLASTSGSLVVPQGGIYATPQIIINGPTATVRNFDLQTSSAARWRLQAGAQAETGTANAGSDLQLLRFGDAGLLDTPLVITRSTGKISLTAASGGTQITGGLNFGSVNAAGTTDLSKHVSLFSTTYGIGITTNRQNYVVPATAAHVLTVGTVDVLSVGSASIAASVTTTAPTPAVGDNSTNVATTAFVQANMPVTLGRNILHNPLFNVQQRGLGPWTTSDVYTADRWMLHTVTADTDSVTITALADADRTAIGDEAATSALTDVFVGSATAGSVSYVMQRVEGVRRLAGKTVTISCWAISASGTPKLGFGYLQAFGTGGSPSGNNAAVNGQSVTIGTTWARYSVTLAIPSAATKVLGTNNNDYTQIELWFSGAAAFNSRNGTVGVQSNTISLWGMQVELSGARTPLEKPSLVHDLAHCQRFYTTFSAYVPVTTAPQTLVLPTTMRGTPAVAGGGAGFVTTGAAASAAVVTVAQTTGAAQTLTFTADL